ncbi:sensor histidine kinase [Nitrosopumilus sp.]|uniref:sensor histidine kinase n=1 Tax=Nitrosopumilus sp. TaxID=2024843 RepID=UPI002931EF82|nr:sensor histidine kinase [Nitrosopumilus sp.]
MSSSSLPLWSVNRKKWLWYVIPTVLAISLIAIALEIHNNEEEAIHESFLENQMEIQKVVTKAIADNISSEIKLMISEMTLLANSDELQKDLGTAESSKLIQETFQKMNSIAPTVQILAIDENAEVVSQISRHHKKLVGENLKWLPYFSKDSEKHTEPQIDTVRGHPFKGPEIAIIYPVTNKQTEDLQGFIVTTLPSDRFFARHGNIFDIDSQFIVVLDKHYTYIVGPSEKLIGENFFGPASQEHFDYNQDQNVHYEQVFSGSPTQTLYDYGLGERLNTGMPIMINGNDELFLQVITPTNVISGEVSQIISAGKVQTSVLIITIVAILGILLFRRTKIFEQEKMATVGQLSSNIAHDMRNPLGTIKSSTRRIQNQNKKNNDNEIVSDEITRINRAVKRMSHQIEGVLNYVRSTPIIPTKASVTEMLNYSLDVINIPKNIKVHLPEKDTTIECDSEKMENVFVNLMLNAVQAIGNDNHGNITIRLDEKSKDIRIEFENSGPPIPDDKISHIFKPLFTTKLKGTGLGLSGCKNIIEQHNGKISVASDPVTFTITLPKKLDDKLIDKETRNELNSS